MRSLPELAVHPFDTLLRVVLGVGEEIVQRAPPDRLKTDYLWREVLTRESLTNILENYAQIVETKDEKTGKRKKTQIWPRYHQIDAVRHLLADAGARGTGHRYLIQHAAGSGKSNSIAWLAHQLIGLAKDDVPVFHSIIVVTDRRILDRQIRDMIRQYAQVGATVGYAERSGDLRRFIETGKKIIISTVQKFPFILDEIPNEALLTTAAVDDFCWRIENTHAREGGFALITGAPPALARASRYACSPPVSNRFQTLPSPPWLTPRLTLLTSTESSATSSPSTSNPTTAGWASKRCVPDGSPTLTPPCCARSCSSTKPRSSTAPC